MRTVAVGRGGRSAIFAAALLAHAGACGRAYASCPSYTRSSSANDKKCDVEAVTGTNPSEAQWRAIFEQVAQGPRRWGSRGPSIADLKVGCAHPHKVAAHFPCEIVRAIALKESNWRQFCKPTWPNDQKGKSSRTIISFDCGYGVSQVTSGMRAKEKPSFARKRVAAEALYNMATGASILARKWQVTPCVGDRDPDVIENWYIALWAYNGLSYANNPTNPVYDSARGVYNPNVGGAYPYQEKVFGIIENPPSKLKRIQGRGIRLAYPRLEDVAVRGKKIRALAEPSCASPTDCSHHRSVTRTGCTGLAASGPADAGVPHGPRGVAPDAARPASDGGGEAEAFASARGTDGCSCAVGVRSGDGPASGALCALLPFGWAIVRLRRRRTRAQGT